VISYASNANNSLSLVTQVLENVRGPRSKASSHEEEFRCWTSDFGAYLIRFCQMFSEEPSRSLTAPGS
jgi:hypothetical protein